MNIYIELNKIMEYVEENLEEKIEISSIAKMLGMNEYTFQRVFAVIANISFSEYIRNRRLSNAGQEMFLNTDKIVDIAVKYGYNNATAFSRAFERFHGIKPSEVRKNPQRLKMYTRLHFNEQYEHNKKFDYKIITREEIILYGTYVITDNEKIRKDAPEFYERNSKQYGDAPYGMTEYHDRERTNVKAYWVMYEENLEGRIKKVIPQSKWIQMRTNSQEAEEIQMTSDSFYEEFLANSKYNYKDLPELEYYHNGVTDFLIAIED